MTIPILSNRSLLDPLYNGDSFEAASRVVRTTPGVPFAWDSTRLTHVICDPGTSRNLTINPVDTAWTWLQCGDQGDVVDASVGHGGIINTGGGGDVVRLGARRVVVSGRGGADTFYAADSGEASLHGFVVGEDRLDANGVSLQPSADAAGNLTFSTPSGGIIRVLGIPLSAASRVLQGG